GCGRTRGWPGGVPVPRGARGEARGSPGTSWRRYRSSPAPTVSLAGAGKFIGYKEAEPCEPASREEGRGSWLMRTGGGNRNGHRHRVEHRDRLRRKLEPGRFKGQDRRLRPGEPAASYGRLACDDRVEHLPKVQFQDQIEIVAL